MTFGLGIRAEDGPLKGAIVYPCVRDIHCDLEECCFKTTKEPCLCDMCFKERGKT